MIDFEVEFEYLYYPQRSKVYYIDSTRDRFLVVVDNGDFYWADTSDCKIVKENENDQVRKL